MSQRETSSAACECEEVKEAVRCPNYEACKARARAEHEEGEMDHDGTTNPVAALSRVWKYALPAPTNGIASVWISYAAEPISVGVQDGAMVVWAHVGGNVEQYASDWHDFIVVNTGQEFPNRYFDGGEAKFLGTVTSENGIVWHVWDAGWQRV